MQMTENKNYLYFFIFLILTVFSVSFYSLGKKEFWKDESATLIYATGHSLAEIRTFLKTQNYSSAEKLLSFSKSESGDAKAFLLSNHLIQEDVQHPPLYYWLLSKWVHVFGDSVFSARALSVLFGLLGVFSFLYLSAYLFSDINHEPINYFLPALIFAVSPYFFVFAQEAREYSLFCLLMTSSTLALCKKRWILYAILLTLCFYTSLFALEILVAQTCFVFAKSDFKKDRKIFFLCLLSVFVFCAPWFWQLLQANQSLTDRLSWMNEPVPAMTYLMTVIGFLPRAFFDIHLTLTSDLPKILIGSFLSLIVLAILFFSFIKLLKDRRPSSYFVIGLLLSSLFLTIGLDLLHGGGRRALSGRYWMGTMVALELMLSYFLILKSDNIKKYIFAFLIMLGLGSILWNSQQNSWWNKGALGNTWSISEKINSTLGAIVFADSPEELMSIARYLKPETSVQLVENIDLVSKSSSNNFYFFKLLDSNRPLIETKFNTKLISVIKGLEKFQ